MAFKVIEQQWKGGALLAELSDCWTFEGKPVFLKLRKIPSSPSNVAAWSLVIGPLHIGFGWHNNKRKPTD